MGARQPGFTKGSTGLHVRFTTPGYTLDEQASLDDPTKGGCVHKALSLAREDAARSGRRVPSVMRRARPQGRRRPLRRTEPARQVARPLPPLPRPAPARTFWRRFGDDRDLVGLKITLLVAMGALAALLEFPQ